MRVEERKTQTEIHQLGGGEHNGQSVTISQVDGFATALNIEAPAAVDVTNVGQRVFHQSVSQPSLPPSLPPL